MNETGSDKFRCNSLQSTTKLENLLVDPRYRLIKTSMDRAIRTYIQQRREKIPEFVQHHFSLAGSIRINKKALGADIVKAPINIAWALPYTAAMATSSLLGRLGLKKAEEIARKLPPGMKTSVQSEVEMLIFRELLELPTKGGTGGQPDALLAEILNQPEIQHLFQDHLTQISIKAKQAGFRKSLESRLEEYCVSRTSIAELSANIIALGSGAGMLSKMTPGGLSFGAGLAAAIAQQSAISSFVFGPTLGGLYYGVFPASASLGLAVATTSSVLAVLAIFSAFSGVVTDPIQAKLGIHTKRLNHLVDSLEDTLMNRGNTELKLREQYLARVFDLYDLLKTAANTVF